MLDCIPALLGVPAGLYVEPKSYGLCFPPNACKPSFATWHSWEGAPGPPNVSPRVVGLALWALLEVRWSGRRTSDAPHRPTLFLARRSPVFTYGGDLDNSHLQEEGPAVKTQLNACLCAVESGSLSRMLFLFLNMNGFANKLILVYNCLTQHFFFCFLSFFPLSLLSFFFFCSLFLSLYKEYFYSVAFTPRHTLKSCSDVIILPTFKLIPSLG